MMIVCSVNISQPIMLYWAYEIIVDAAQLALPSEQHSQYQWFSIDTLLNQDTVHKHSQWYFEK